MTNDAYPEPASDPEASGLPDTADDDSTAWDDTQSGRVADGPDPAALPGDRPQGMNRYGTTPGEARTGESLDQKLGREAPDPALSETSRPADTAVPPPTPEPVDEEPLDRDAVEGDTSPIPASPDDAVSMYDSAGDEKVGRLVEPDEGAPYDTEADAIASDAGSAGGGPSAEELAIHPVEE